MTKKQKNGIDPCYRCGSTDHCIQFSSIRGIYQI